MTKEKKMTLYEKLTKSDINEFAEWYVKNMLFNTDYCNEWCNKKCEHWEECLKVAKGKLNKEVML